MRAKNTTRQAVEPGEAIFTSLSANARSAPRILQLDRGLPGAPQRAAATRRRL